MYAGSYTRICLTVKTELVKEERHENHWCVGVLPVKQLTRCRLQWRPWTQSLDLTINTQLWHEYFFWMFLTVNERLQKLWANKCVHWHNHVLTQLAEISSYIYILQHLRKFSINSLCHHPKKSPVIWGILNIWLREKDNLQMRYRIKEECWVKGGTEGEERRVSTPLSGQAQKRGNDYHQI